MTELAPIENVMDLLEVRVEAFAICEVNRTAALRCGPLDDIVVHFVLEGEGRIQYENGSCELRRNSVVVVPRRLSKLISGCGPITSIFDAEQHCPLDSELGRFKAGVAPDLMLGCAAVEAKIGGALDVFEHLWEPMVEHAGSELTPLFALIRHEMTNSAVGKRAVVGALMKQVLIGVFRNQLRREPYRSWLWPAMMDPNVATAALSMMSHPCEPHTIQDLAALTNMSRSSFTKHFTAAFHRSPMEFLQLVRLQTAKRLLLNSSLPVKSVATAVGYASRSHFSRCFSAEYGTDPTAFRRQGRAPQPPVKLN